MDRSFLLVADTQWLVRSGSHEKRLSRQHLCPIGTELGHLRDDCSVLVKFRREAGGLASDDLARITSIGAEHFIRSQPLAEYLTHQSSAFTAFFIEGTEKEARCVTTPLDGNTFVQLEADEPTLRLGSFGLPPQTVCIVDSLHVLSPIYKFISRRDPELFGTHATTFLDAPNILGALFTHIMALRSEDNISFSIQLKKVSEQLRALLLEHGKSVRIEKVAHSHLDCWADVQGQRISFLDGGMARISSVAGFEPTAFRVGIYSVRPGVVDPEQREAWAMKAFVTADLLEGATIPEETEPKRLQEAVRYVLEPLTGLDYVRQHSDIQVLLLHGPLVNQFTTYNEGKPNDLPCLDPKFLEQFGITKEAVETSIQDIPQRPNGASLWNQFMAVYGHITKATYDNLIPMVGVVERAASRSLAQAVIKMLADDRVITDAYVKRLDEILNRYEIADDFLFGCVLRAGEYVTPVALFKNEPRRAVDRWQPVVRQYASPLGTMMKTEEAKFPFRVEFNAAAANRSSDILRLVYHTSRLLPEYAFPVGLDIADKYAKVPDWISKGVSAELSALILKRAIRTGDANLVAQVRQLLARRPRDFFFRPTVAI